MAEVAAGGPPDFTDGSTSTETAPLVGYLDAASRQGGIARAKHLSIERLQLRPGATALDVGCGTGDEVVAMAARVGRRGAAVGVDLRPQLTAEARGRHPSTPARFVAAAGEQLPFVPAAFDACRMERTLQHVRHPEAVVDEVLRVVRPQGRVALLEPDWETLVIAGADDTVSATIWAAHITRSRHPRIGRHLQALLGARGVQDTEVETTTVVVRSWDYAAAAFGLVSAARHATAVGRVTQAASGRWIRDLEAAAHRGRFLVAVTMFCASGRAS